MKRVLVIFFLSVRSSYAENTEVAAIESEFDTIQFYSSDSGAWRIKTYAIDQDVHAWSLGNSVPDIVHLARANTEKHYGDVLAEGYVIETDEELEGLRAALSLRGLSDHLEISDNGYVFWAPVGSEYRTKSKPQ